MVCGMDFPRAHWIPQAATMLQPCVAGLPGYLPMSSYDGGKGLPGLGEVGSSDWACRKLPTQLLGLRIRLRAAEGPST